MSNEDSPGQESPGNDRGTVSIEVEISEALLDLINEAKPDDETVPEFVANAALGWCQRSLDGSVQAKYVVPDRAARLGNLIAEDIRVRGVRVPLRERCEVSGFDYAMDVVDLDIELPDDE